MQIYKIGLWVGLSLVAFKLSATEPLQLFACDSCDAAQLQQIAMAQTPALHCNALQSDAQHQQTCYAPVKQLLVANPVTDTAFKFEVKGRNLLAGQSGYVAQVPLSDAEQEIVTTYATLYSTITETATAFENTALTVKVSPEDAADKHSYPLVNASSEHCTYTAELNPHTANHAPEPASLEPVEQANQQNGQNTDTDAPGSEALTIHDTAAAVTVKVDQHYMHTILISHCGH